MSAVCTWCGSEVEPGDGYRLAAHPGDRGAVFCRLEHVVPWALRGGSWVAQAPAGEEAVAECAQCGERLVEEHLVLVRHRGEHRIPDGFCSVDHLLAWAKAGGRWRT